ncbi:acyl-(acyl-carrier-protein)--UDP-N-acetylglucosamine O-acyltransferase [Thermodesulfobium narugense DSM 14796]|uniref:Acyl-(Acyl-carrier-protein)--UDP-N-acetylglucosamine O-acyltransferase n=1 Tax=Thermodesulfobium narugense DSM 14796 TaxID=747365 RepID=M1E5G1_9BACT|nr:acyl-ACP--UDP-N-acetylglucosamine O-acyltransferase [Thermodesulfobium narugense]AEE13713.1 acyl-(acyl-carrier-protein)--UDP-N-acetylglucosamine O-acyltransferase [Thermodesulfobium narugense DSM 14796]
MIKVHPTSIVSPKAIVGEGVEIGPFCVVDDDVVIGENTRLANNVLLKNGTRIGKNCYISTGSCLGQDPQDFHFKGEKSFVRIADNVTIREYVVIHKATGEGEETYVGENSYLMCFTHLGHNAKVYENCTLAAYVVLGGHVVVEREAFLGGASAFHQFVRVGRMCMVGGLAKVVQDIPPFVMYDGNPARPKGLNLVALRRNNFSQEKISAIKKIYKIIVEEVHSKEELIDILKRDFSKYEEHKDFVDFIMKSKRGFRRVQDK